jgi:hypothetical protein
VGRRALDGADEDGGTAGEVRRRQTLPLPGRRPLRRRQADGVGGGGNGAERYGKEEREKKRSVTCVTGGNCG